MIFEICLWVAVAIFTLLGIWALVLAKIPYKSGRVIEPFRVFFVDVFVTSFVMFIPVYVQIFENASAKVLKVIALSLHNTIRLFILDGEFTIVSDNVLGLGGWIEGLYTGFFSVLFVLAPILTFGVVLSFFQNVDSYKRFLLSFYKEIYVFSELNAKSVALAKSLKKANKKRVVVFCDVFEQNEEESFELVEKAKEIDAILFKKDISAINFRVHSSHRKLAFLAIGEGDSENIKQAMELIERYGDRQNTELYVFSRTIGSELMLSKAMEDKNAALKQEKEAKEAKKKAKKKARLAKREVTLSEEKKQKRAEKERKKAEKAPRDFIVRRINDARSLILHLLYEDGGKIFESALTEYKEPHYFYNIQTKTQEKKKCISAVVVGMGLYGREMIKGLTWFCQMEGYTFRLHAFEKDPGAEAKFRAECPELLEDRCNRQMDDVNEAQYDITIHSGVEIPSDTFFNELKKIGDISFVFVSLGDDDMNVGIATQIRAALRRMAEEGHRVDKATIQTVVYDNNKNRALNGVFDFSGKDKYDVDFVGSLESYYSEPVLLNSSLEEEALRRHLAWGDEKSFWMCEYNFRSSSASVVHRRYKLRMSPGKEILALSKEERSEEQKYVLRTMEHRRWNAYMRTEGWSYAPVRNNLAKTHHNLVLFNELSLKDQEKDDD